MPIEVIRGERVQLIETEERHDYLLDGRPIPGCTSILQRAGYVDLSMVPAHVLQAKAEFGTKIHEFTHWYDEGDLDLNDLIGFPEYARRVEGWAQFREDWDFTPDLEWSEKPLAICVNGMSFGLKPDCIGAGRFGHGGTSAMCVIEKKTTVNIERAAELQTAAQALIIKSPDNPIPPRIICQLLDGPNRLGKFYNVKFCTNRADERLFLSCLSIDIDKRNSGVIQ